MVVPMVEEAEITAMREAAARNVDQYGLRRIARQIGMSPSGLKKFLKGAAPYRKTLHKVSEWSARAAVEDTRSPRDVLVDELVETVPEGARDHAREQIVRILEQAFRWPMKVSPDGKSRVSH